MDNYTTLEELKRAIERFCKVIPTPNIRERLYTARDILEIPDPNNRIKLARLEACFYELSVTNSIPYTFVGTDANDVPLYQYKREAS